jgi:hypothetical protein
MITVAAITVTAITVSTITIAAITVVSSISTASFELGLSEHSGRRDGEKEAQCRKVGEANRMLGWLGGGLNL